MSPVYPWIDKPIEARFIERVNRFACLVDHAGKPTKVYLPNSGRLEELLHPGATVLLEKRRTVGKTYHDLLLVQSSRYPDGAPLWVGIDSRLPSKLLRWAVETGMLQDFRKPSRIRNEPQVGDGRLDLMIECDDSIHFIETKSVNLLDTDGTARFPDAPTIRGKKHIENLMSLTSEDFVPWLIFIVMREDALAFSPFAERDPEFTDTLHLAMEAGVKIVAMKYAAGANFRFIDTVKVLLPSVPFPGFWPLDHSADVGVYGP
ncbi:MAG: DNA/RNA nuclease SfsA [Anaerolineales bacterium]|nr:DNA/RNA nuclease SfsA [Anaerolineales bacterium]